MGNRVTIAEKVFWNCGFNVTDALILIITGKLINYQEFNIVFNNTIVDINNNYSVVKSIQYTSINTFQLHLNNDYIILCF